MKRHVLILAACIGLVAASVLAHGGEEHVVGTVSSIASDSITVKTGAKSATKVDVAAKTTFSTGKRTAKLTDLHVGDRVVIHATEPVEGKLVADTVEFSTPKPAQTTAPPAKKKS